MTDIGNTNYENYGRKEGCNYDGPDSPYKSSTGVGNTEESYSNATLDGDGPRSIEEFGDEEELLLMISSARIRFR